MGGIAEKGGGSFAGVKLLLCENPLPPIDEAIAAARDEAAHGNFYTEPHSAPLRTLIAQHLGVPERLVHINAGSELILRQLFDRFGQKVHLLTPTYTLFTEIAERYTETCLSPLDGFAFDLQQLAIPDGTTLMVIVNPNNPNGGVFDMAPLPGLLRRHPQTYFLVDEAFIGMAGESVAHLVPGHRNLLVTRTLSKAHSLAGFRVGYAILPKAIADKARITGRIVQLPASNAHEIEQYLSAIREAGLVVEDVEIRKADLEDVFLEVMNGNGKVQGAEFAV